MNPETGILIGLTVVFIIALFIWPRNGLIARWQKRATDKKKELLEDALKHLYNKEYQSTECSKEALASKLSLNIKETEALLERLIAMDLLEYDNGCMKLTTDGNSYALRMIRVHRLWERYLADETSFKAEEWHFEAEKIEHKLSDVDAEELAARIGNPLVDPHGDPIPTADGRMPQYHGKNFADIRQGESAVIIHLEDEPKTIFEQLAAIGLYPGMQVKMLEKSNERIRFEANGEICVLAPQFVDNIFVREFRPTETEQTSFRVLSDLKLGEESEVLGISKLLRGLQRRRLLDFGIVPGAKISAEMKSLTGNPTAYRIRGTAIALRKDQSDKIFIKEKEEVNK